VDRKWHILLAFSTLSGLTILAYAQEVSTPSLDSVWKLTLAALPSILSGIAWLLDNLWKTVLAFLGAVITYLFMGLPESRILKKRLKMLWPKATNVDRAVALVLILVGTLLALVILQPGNYPTQDCHGRPYWSTSETT
jgi:hypothetical protein